MEKTNKIAGFILGAAAGIALVKFFRMPKEDREVFCNHLKTQTNQLLDNAEDTIEIVEQYMDEFKSKDDEDWIERLLVLKKMFRNLYGSEKNYLL